MFYGADYYPEHWPEERWARDAELMQQAGINVVRLAEFAWSKLEPSEGVFDFDWLERALDTLNARGVKAVLCTPTPTPPDWLMMAHPEAVHVNQQGQRSTIGTRRHGCPSSQAYRAASRRITEAMAKRFGKHPGVIGWQLDNEFGCHSTHWCFCEACQRAFQEWLKAKYVTLEALNERWGTIFWSQTYTAWEHIPVPGWSVAGHSPSLQLEFRRFSSDNVVSFAKEQVDLLRAQISGQFITHNLMGLWDALDDYDLAELLDFVVWDNYPGIAPAGQPSWDWRLRAGLSGDIMRGAKGQNVWVMEQQSGPTGGYTATPHPRPGDIRALAWQQIAHGADGIVFFRWRVAQFGSEQCWHGILGHDGRPNRRYKEVSELGAEVKQVGKLIQGSIPSAQIGMVRCFNNDWALQISPPAPGFEWSRQALTLAEAARRQGLGMAVLGPMGAFDGYQALVLPTLMLANEAIAGHCRHYVENGGTLIATFRLGSHDRELVSTDLPLPGHFAETFGIEIPEYDPMGTTFTNAVETESGEWEARTWADLVEPKDAEVIGRFKHDYYAGMPAVTRNRLGRGQAIYVATELPAGFWRNLLAAEVEAPEAVKPYLPLAGHHFVEVLARVGASGEWYVFCLNHGGEAVPLPQVPGAVEVLVGPEPGGQLPPNGVQVLCRREL